MIDAISYSSILDSRGTSINIYVPNIHNKALYFVLEKVAGMSNFD